MTALAHTSATIYAAAVARPTGRAASAGRWRLAFFLAALSLLAAILLTSVSVWFLGAVALAGAGPAAAAFDFHTPGALVRLFAITRTLGKYGERLSGHAAALTDQVTLRLTIFEAMAAAPAARAVGWQLGREDRLTDWLDDVEDRDNERLRVQFPAITLVFGFLLLCAATVWIAPAALLPILLLSGAIGLLGRRTKRTAAAAEAEARTFRRRGSGDLGATLQSLVPLAAEGRREHVTEAALRSFHDAEMTQRSQNEALADLDLVVGLFGPFAVLSVLVASWYAGARAEALLPAAFIGFGWLALAEAGGVLSRILLGQAKAEAARANLAMWTEGAAEPPDPQPLPTRVGTVRLQAVRVAAPDGRPIGEPLDIAFHTGRPTAITGVSGSGKTTLLKTVAGWLEPAAGTICVNGAAQPSGVRRQIAHLGLHDAAILADTIRANLFADDASETELAEALAAVELTGRVTEAGGLDAWIAQDRLSLGEAQRLNLARALLTKAPFVLLDEPTEHLDPEQAVRILARLRRRCGDRILVYTAHRPPLLGDTLVRL